MNKRRLALTALTLMLLTSTASAWAWAIVWSTIEQIAVILSFGIIHPVEAVSIATAALIKANPCVYAGSSLTDQCEILGRSVSVDATIRAMNVLFIRALMPLFIFLFLLLGLYMILMQGSPKGRAEAKAFFIDLTVGMILVGLSPVIYQITMNISSGLTEQLWSLSGVSYNDTKQWWQGGPESRVYCYFFWIAFAVSMCALIVVGFRYFMVMLFAAIFPLSLFLYTFRFTKGVGNTLMKFSLLAIFTQVPMMVFFVLGIKAFSDSTLGTVAFRILFGTAAMTALVCTPLILLKVMHWIGGAVYAYSSRGGGKGVRALSQLMRGKDVATALTTVAGRYETAHTLGDRRYGERMPTGGWSKIPDEQGRTHPNYPLGGVSWDNYPRTGQRVPDMSMLTGDAPNTGASVRNVTPDATDRAREPPQTAPSTEGGAAQAPAVSAEGASPVSSAPSGSEGVGGPAAILPPTPEQKALQAYMQPYEVGDTQALLAGTQAPATVKGKEGKPPADISGRLAAIQKNTQKRIAGLEKDFERDKYWAEKAGESYGTEGGGGEDLHAPIPGHVHSPITPRPPVEPKGQKEITPPDWYGRAKGVGFDNLNTALETLAKNPHRADHLLDQVDNAKGSEEYKDKTADDLLELATKGKLKGSEKT